MAPSLFSLAHGESPPSKRLKSTLPNGRSLHDDVSAAHAGPPPPKAKETEETAAAAATVETDAETEIIQPHPLRIKPSGNAFTSSTNLRDTSCGQLALFPDELILQVLGYLVADDLNALAATSKALYGFSRTEELWKALFIGYVETELPACVSDFCQMSVRCLRGMLCPLRGPASTIVRSHSSHVAQEP